MTDEFQLDKYLARICYGGAVAANLKTLSALVAAHVDAIAFEGLDPLLRRPVNLDLASVQSKLVDGRRGGYCFEQNTLFKAALATIGFRVTGLAGRVRWMSPPDSPLGPKVRRGRCHCSIATRACRHMDSIRVRKVECSSSRARSGDADDRPVTSRHADCLSNCGRRAVDGDASRRISCDPEYREPPEARL